MDTGLLAALVAGSASSIGVLVNLFLMLAQRKGILSSIDIERAKLQWAREAILLEVGQSARKEIGVEVSRHRLDCFMKIAGQLTIINQKMRDALSEVNSAVAARAGEVSSAWAHDYSEEMIISVDAVLTQGVEAILLMNAEESLLFPRSLHAYCKEYWTPSIRRQREELVEALRLDLKQELAAKEPREPKRALIRISAIAGNIISINRDFKEQLAAHLSPEDISQEPPLKRAVAAS